MHQTVEETLRAYVRAFESLDPDAVVPFYHVPCMFIGPPGATVVSDAATARHIASGLVEHARSQGYHHTEILDLVLKTLADNLASLAGVFVRFNGDNEEISRFGFAYTMFDDGTMWRIMVAIAYDAPAATG